jgi:hypothetical protein
VAGLNCSFWDAWPSPRVVWACLSLPDYLLDLPHASLSLGPRASWRMLECLGLSFACGRVGVDVDVMAVRLVKLVFRAPAEAGRLHGRQLLSPRDMEIRLPACVGGLARVVCLRPHTSRSRTCRARRRLVVRGFL